MRTRGRDSDLDGIADADDRCPTEAGPRSDQPARNGCPNLDSDGDGVDDYAMLARRKRVFDRRIPSENGCPDSDNDHILDKKDKCPHEPAQADPGDANLGCPKFAHLRGDKFVLSRPVRADAASPADDAVLSEIAFALRANMALSKVSVEVTLQGQDDDEALVERAADRAGRSSSGWWSSGWIAIGSCPLAVCPRARRRSHLPWWKRGRPPGTTDVAPPAGMRAGSPDARLVRAASRTPHNGHTFPRPCGVRKLHRTGRPVTTG